MKKYLLTLIAIGCLLVFAGCSSSTTSTSDLVGSWGVSEEYGPVTLASGQEVNGTVGLEYTFADDGTYTLNATNEVVGTDNAAQTDEVELEGKYTVNGNEVTLTPENVVKNEVTQLSNVASADGLTEDNEVLFDQFDEAEDLIGESETYTFDISDAILTINYEDDVAISFEKN